MHHRRLKAALDDDVGLGKGGRYIAGFHVRAARDVRGFAFVFFGLATGISAVGGFVFGAGGDAGGPDDGRALGDGCVHGSDGLEWVIVDLDQFGAIGCGGWRISQHHGDRLTDENHALAGEHQAGAR